MLSSSQVLTPAASRYVAEMARVVRPAAERVNRRLSIHLRKAGHDAAQIRALLAVTPSAAASKFPRGARARGVAAFLEQVEYNGRRLAKMNVTSTQVREALDACDALLAPVLAGRFQPAREQLQLATILTLNDAYFRVREAETQALFGIYGAEAAATAQASLNLEDLLHRFVRVLTPALHADAGRIVVLPQPATGKLAKPLYIERGQAAVKLVADGAMRERYASFWSYPLGASLVAQFGFAAKYPWLPRELTLLGAVAERCAAAEARARLEAANERLHAMAHRAEEVERRRIGRELHDEAGQCLLLLRLQLEMMERTAPAGLRAQMAESRGLAVGVVTEIRRIVAALSPAVLERLGLSAALRQLAARFRKMAAARVEVRTALGRKPLPQAVQEVVYRVAQESLLNIAKHSGAKHVKVSVRTADSWIRLEVSDDGGGFDEESAAGKPESFGLAGMRTRAALLGGSLTVESAIGKGVTVRLAVPISVAVPISLEVPLNGMPLDRVRLNRAQVKAHDKNTRIVD